MIGNSNDETNFLHKLLSTNRQVASLHKAFARNSSTAIKLSKTQLSKMIQSGGFLGRLLGSLLNTGLPLMKNITKSLAKNVLIPLELKAATSAADAGRHKTNLSSGHNTTTQIISNEEMEDIMKMVKSLEDSSLKGVSETIQNEPKEQKGGFLSMLLGIFGASLLENMLTGKIIIRAGYEPKGKGIIRAGYGSKNFNQGFLIPPHPLTNLEMQKYYQNEPRFNGVYSRDNLPKMQFIIK